MNKLRLTLACWDYDRVAAFADGSMRGTGDRGFRKSTRASVRPGDKLVAWSDRLGSMEVHVRQYK